MNTILAICGIILAIKFIMWICKKEPKEQEAEQEEEQYTMLTDYHNGLYRPRDVPQRFICKLAEDNYMVSSAYPMKQSEVKEFTTLSKAASYCHYNLKNVSEASTGLASSNKLRPMQLDDFIGQEKLKVILKLHVQACKNGAILPHCLFAGGAGLGKTTLAGILANELGVKCHSITAPAIRSRQDLVKTILEVKEGDILFIDEIHRLRSDIEELLYPAMEDFKLDLCVGYGETKQLKQITLPKFSLIGATTIAGKINKPLRDRFKDHIAVEFYKTEHLASVVKANSIKLGLELTESASLDVAKRARGTPRVANNLMEKVILYAKGHSLDSVDSVTACAAFELFGIDDNGLTTQDTHVLRCISLSPGGNPIGIKALAATANEDVDTISEAIEPFLLRMGLIGRTSRGRVVTDKGMEVLK